MSGNRTRGLLRAAALLAIGASPLLGSAANAAEAPTDIVDGKFGRAPEVGVDAAKPATDLLGDQAVKLPATLPGGASDVRAPHVAAPAAVQAPTAPVLGDALAAPQARELPATPQLPAPQAPVGEQVPALPGVGGLPIQAPGLG